MTLFTPLAGAVWYRQFGATKWLLQSKVEVNRPKDVPIVICSLEDLSKHGEEALDIRFSCKLKATDRRGHRILAIACDVDASTAVDMLLRSAAPRSESFLKTREKLSTTEDLCYPGLAIVAMQRWLNRLVARSECRNSYNVFDNNGQAALSLAVDGN